MSIKRLCTSAAIAIGMAGGYSEAQAEVVHCREFTQSIVVNGVRQPGYGTACLQPDGSWEIVSDGAGYGRPSYPVAGPVYQAPPPAVPYNQTSTSLSIALGLPLWGHKHYYGDNWDRWHDRYRDYHHSDDHHGRGKGHNKHHADKRRGGKHYSDNHHYPRWH